MSSQSDAGPEPAYRVWRAPRVGTAAAADADAQASAEAEARERGYQAGLAEGRAAGQEEIDTRREQLDAILAALAHPLDTVEEQTERVLAGLACDVAGQLVRRDMLNHPEAIVPVVREAVATIDADSQALEIALHPDDAALVRETVDTEQGQARWQIREDGGLDRGDCVVRSGHASIDARLETRIRQVTDHVLDNNDDSAPVDDPNQEDTS